MHYIISIIIYSIIYNNLYQLYKDITRWSLYSVRTFRLSQDQKLLFFSKIPYQLLYNNLTLQNYKFNMYTYTN